MKLTPHSLNPPPSSFVKKEPSLLAPTVEKEVKKEPRSRPSLPQLSSQRSALGNCPSPLAGISSTRTPRGSRQETSAPEDLSSNLNSFNGIVSHGTDEDSWWVVRVGNEPGVYLGRQGLDFFCLYTPTNYFSF